MAEMKTGLSRSCLLVCFNSIAYILRIHFIACIYSFSFPVLLETYTKFTVRAETRKSPRKQKVSKYIMMSGTRVKIYNGKKIPRHITYHSLEYIV